MRIVEEKEIIRKQIEKVTVGRKCDCCAKNILPDPNVSRGTIYKIYNYFHIVTSHSDWGNDSVDSFESYDACSPECAVCIATEYLIKASKSKNTKRIEINHVCSLDDGTEREYPIKLMDID